MTETPALPSVQRGLPLHLRPVACDRFSLRMSATSLTGSPPPANTLGTVVVRALAANAAVSVGLLTFRAFATAVQRGRDRRQQQIDDLAEHTAADQTGNNVTDHSKIK